VSAEARDAGERAGWGALLRPEWLPGLAVVLGGILLHSMSVMLLATVLPSIVDELGGAALMSWPTTAFLASSIVAATCASLLVAAIGPGRSFCAGAAIFSLGALLCALAPSMALIVGGRFVQGFGGGLLTALVYILVRSTFPERLWPRAFALVAGVWSIAVLLGPLLGGLFARFADWRGAFYSLAALAVVLAVLALRVLPAHVADSAAVRRRAPIGRVALLCLAIAAMSLAAAVGSPLQKAGLIVLAVAALGAMLAANRRAAAPLLPRDAFSPHTPAGAGLWTALLLSLAFTPLHIYAPIFLQRLHGLDPLEAGYAVAGASLAWTLAAIGFSGLAARSSDWLLVGGPLTMAAGLLALAFAMPGGPLAAVLPALALVGAGIGSCWAFNAQGVMRGARRGEEDIAAASVPTVQQAGFALGAAVAGLVANLAGFTVGGDAAGMAPAAFWTSASFALLAFAAALTGARLSALRRRAASSVR